MKTKPQEKRLVTISMRCPADMKAALDQIAEEEERSVSWLCLRAVRTWLVQNGKL